MALTLAFFLMASVYLWFLRCLRTSIEDRKRLRGAVRATPEFWELIAQYEQVSYISHTVARFFLQDPWGLYGDELHRLMEEVV